MKIRIFAVVCLLAANLFTISAQKWFTPEAEKQVDAWKYIRVRVSLVEHIDQTGTEVLVRVYGGPQVSSIREQGAD